MSERLSDEELAALSKFGSEMDGLDELFGNTPGSCVAVGGLIARALAELRHLRSRGLSGEERDLIRNFRFFVMENLEPEPAVERALSVLARLAGES